MPHIPLLKYISKPAMVLFFYIFKGARVAGALSWQNRIRTRTMADYLKPGAKPIIDNGIEMGYSVNDMILEWQITTNAKLTLKNHSKYFAYNIQMLNAGELFAEYKRLEKLTSLAPNESIEIVVSFEQLCYYSSGIDADKVPDIPKNVEYKYLLIQYENESGKKFLTKFLVTFSVIQNEYTYP